MWTSREFAELMALRRMDPPLDRKLEVYSAQIAQVMVNAWSGSDARPKRLKDLLFEFDRRPRTGEDLKQMARMITSAHGGTIE